MLSIFKITFCTTCLTAFIQTCSAIFNRVENQHICALIELERKNTWRMQTSMQAISLEDQNSKEYGTTPKLLSLP